MMGSGKLTIAELSAISGIPETSVRRYIKTFGIMPVAGGARKKLYASSTIAKLQSIKQLYTAGLDTKQVAKALQLQKNEENNENQLQIGEKLDEISEKIDKIRRPWWRK